MKREYIELKLYGETVATVIVLPTWTRTLTITKPIWTRDEALLLVDWLKEHMTPLTGGVDV